MQKPQADYKKLSTDAQLLLKYQKENYDQSIRQHKKHSIIIISALSFIVLALTFLSIVRSHQWQVQKTGMLEKHAREIQNIIDTAFYIKDNLIGEYYIDNKKKFEDFMLVGAAIIAEKYQEHKANIGAKKFTPMNTPEMKTYLEITYAGARLVGIDPYLPLAIDYIESEYNKTAISEAGARGISQFMPFTARLIANSRTNYDILQVGNYELAKLYDPIYSKKLQIRFLQTLFEDFNGRVEWVLLAYNWGPDNTRRTWWKNGETIFNELNTAQKQFANDVLDTYNRFKSKQRP